MTKKLNKLPNLEDSLSEITQLIDRMEHSEQTLEQSLEHFERGITLVRHCQKLLDQAEQKVELLMQNNDKEELTPYETNDLPQGPEIDEADND